MSKHRMVSISIKYLMLLKRHDVAYDENFYGDFRRPFRTVLINDLTRHFVSG